MQPSDPTANPSPVTEQLVSEQSEQQQRQQPPSQAVTEAEPPTDIDPFEELETWLKARTEGPGPPEGEAINPAARSQATKDTLVRIEEMMTQPRQEQQPRQAQTAQPQQQPGPVQPQVSGEPGQQADQESDAFSTVEVTMEQLQLGRPLAAQGLQVKPRKPVFTTLTLLTAAPANPRAELRFRSDGKPARVRLIESSGDPRIDEAVLNSLYRWRASGKKLRELGRGETIPVRIRIVLVQPRGR